MKKALLVDDNEKNLYLLQTMLKHEGYDVLMAGNGVDALDSPGTLLRTSLSLIS